MSVKHPRPTVSEGVQIQFHLNRDGSMVCIQETSSQGLQRLQKHCATVVLLCTIQMQQQAAL